MKPIPTIPVAVANLAALLEAQGKEACPLCDPSKGPIHTLRDTRASAKLSARERAQRHAGLHFGASNTWLGWYQLARLEGDLVALPDEWQTETPADALRDTRATARTWRYVVEHHAKITQAGIRCEYREHFYRELGTVRWVVFVDSAFWDLLVMTGSTIRDAREFHNALTQVIAEVGRRVRAETTQAPDAPEAQEPLPTHKPRQKGRAPRRKRTRAVLAPAPAPTPAPAQRGGAQMALF